MLKIENTETYGWEAAIRGMRNPKNSWDRSDSGLTLDSTEVLPGVELVHPEAIYKIGPNDHLLMTQLASLGPVHGKFRRMIGVSMDITAPLYWWKEFDTYKVGTVANSCSTMHKIHAKEFTLDDFSHEHIHTKSEEQLFDTVELLNYWRDIYLNGGFVDDGNADGGGHIFEPKSYTAWIQLIQLLPSSYNQKRTVMLNYEVLANIHANRRHHKLDEWHTLCDWIEQLPYSEIIHCSEKKGGEN